MTAVPASETPSEPACRGMSSGRCPRKFMFQGSSYGGDIISLTRYVRLGALPKDIASALLIDLV